MGLLFGTDGIRGIANTELSCELSYNVGRAGAYVLTGTLKHTPKILVATDTRISKDMLSSALISGICSVGADAFVAGVIPTPAVAYLVRKYSLDAGVMISASHNPVEYNGIKFFDSRGYKLPDELENQIEEILLQGLAKLPVPTGKDIGEMSSCVSGLNDYIDYLTDLSEVDFKGLKVVLDCANGSSYVAAPEVFTALGAKVFVIHNDPDGRNINKNCGSTHMDDLKKAVVSFGADIGFAFDGDADRCLVVDEKGEVIDGDGILAICGSYLKEKGKLSGNAVVGTVMTNLGLDIFADNKNIKLLKTDVGDRYVLEKMLSEGYILGGEQSGHIIFLEHNTTGDGILTAIKVAEVLKEKGCTASELGGIMEVMPQVLVNAKVSNSNKEKFMDYPEICSEINALERYFAGNGRVLIRPSGTEPLVRVMIEGKNPIDLKEKAENLAALIERVMQ